MAGYPPPPAGTPPPPQPPGWDPWQQRRYMRDQAKAQRAAAKAQAAQWRYQSRAMRRGSILAPLLMITVGVVFLLIETGRIDRVHFWGWYSQWWPLLLVGAGLVVLAEWALDQYSMRDPTRPQYRRTFGGGVSLLIVVFIVTGIVSAHVNNRRQFGIFPGMHFDSDSLDEVFGDKHESDQTLEAAFPEGSSLTVVNPRGDVTISGTSDDGKLHIALHKQVYAHSDSDAESRSEQLSPQVQQPSFNGAGGVTVTMPSLEGARGDLIITVPGTTATTVTANRGDIHIASIKGNVTATANRGDVDLSAITGQVTTHINNGRSSLTAHSIEGGLTIQGHAQDLTLADITGPVTLSGDFFGTTHMARVNGAIRFHTSRADFEMARLDGQTEIQRDSDVSADQVMGPLILTTRNGNVTLDRVAGDVTVTNRNGTIDLTAAPTIGNITLVNRNGSIRATLPQNAGFAVEAVSTDGSVESDFQLTGTQSDDRKSLRGNVGTGGPTVRLTTIHGDISLRKGDIQPIPPVAPAAPRITMTPQAAPAPAAPQPRVPRAPKQPSVPRTPRVPSPPDVPMPQ